MSEKKKNYVKAPSQPRQFRLLSGLQNRPVEQGQAIQPQSMQMPIIEMLKSGERPLREAFVSRVRQIQAGSFQTKEPVVEEKKEIETVLCGRCQRPNPLGSKFCNICGYEIGPGGHYTLRE